jgi:hypothetical protein
MSLYCVGGIRISVFFNNLVTILVSFPKYVKLALFFFLCRMIFGVVWFVFFFKCGCGMVTIVYYGFYMLQFPFSAFVYDGVSAHTVC